MDRLVESCRVDIESNEDHIRQLEKFRAEYVSVFNLLEFMPQTLNPKVLVPMGSKCGFFYGHLKHTNEIMAHLGDNYFSKMTAPQARQLVSKRIKELDDQIDVLRGHKKRLSERIDVVKEISSAKGESEEIKEEYNENAEKDWLEKHRASVAREREAARLERERNQGKVEEDPLQKLLKVRDEDEGEEEEEDDDDDDDWDSDEEDDDDEEDNAIPVPPIKDLARSNSFEKRVKWNLDAVHKAIGGDKVLPPPEPKIAPSIRIKFHHSSTNISQAGSNQNSESKSSSSDAFQSPADIYAKFTTSQQPKSILKKTPAVDPPRSSSVPLEAAKTKLNSLPTSTPPIAKTEPTFVPQSTAISDKVVERVPVPLAESSQTNAGAPRPVSKFRKDRTVQG